MKAPENIKNLKELLNRLSGHEAERRYKRAVAMG
jgi:hypothetical protein